MVFVVPRDLKCHLIYDRCYSKKMIIIIMKRSRIRQWQSSLFQGSLSPHIDSGCHSNMVILRNMVIINNNSVCYTQVLKHHKEMLNVIVRTWSYYETWSY